MKPEIKVVVSTIQATTDGKVYLKCEMSDGSTWTCDMHGANWRKEKPSDAVLTILFNESLADKKV